MSAVTETFYTHLYYYNMPNLCRAACTDSDSLTDALHVVVRQHYWIFAALCCPTVKL